MDSIENVKHKKFKYVFIPREMGNPVEVCEFEGVEKDFKKVLGLYFGREQMLAQEKEQLSKDLLATAATKAIDEEQLTRAVELSQTYQIIPLTLPTKKNNFNAINAYIDNVGRVKNLQTNARASRITNDDIRGDCFISRTFDDEDKFERIDFTMEDYDAMMAAPPSSSGRWSHSDALLKLQQQMQGATTASEPPVEGKPPRCQQCFKKTENGVALKKCGRCGKVGRQKTVRSSCRFWLWVYCSRISMVCILSIFRFCSPHCILFVSAGILLHQRMPTVRLEIS